jgi:hypothetical protein
MAESKYKTQRGHAGARGYQHFTKCVHVTANLPAAGPVVTVFVRVGFV